MSITLTYIEHLLQALLLNAYIIPPNNSQNVNGIFDQRPGKSPFFWPGVWRCSYWVVDDIVRRPTLTRFASKCASTSRYWIKLKTEIGFKDWSWPPEAGVHSNRITDSWMWSLSASTPFYRWILERDRVLPRSHHEIAEVKYKTQTGPKIDEHCRTWIPFHKLRAGKTLEWPLFFSLKPQILPGEQSFQVRLTWETARLQSSVARATGLTRGWELWNVCVKVLTSAIMTWDRRGWWGWCCYPVLLGKGNVV